MKIKINIENLTHDQCRKLVKHLDELSDVQAATYNGFIVAISKTVLKRCPADIADTLHQLLNEWSSLLNRVTDSSSAEMGRILGTDSSTSTLQ
jgi:hypothetical protein